MSITITNITDLQKIGNDPGYPLDGDYELGNDIDASATSGWNAGAGFEPIGSYASPFTGTFDGKSYSITDLYINRPATGNVALFGAIGAGTVCDLNITNCSIIGDDYVGMLAGDLIGSTIDNVHVEGSVSGLDDVGGLCSYNDSGIITNCTVSGTVAGTGFQTDAAGFCMYNDEGSILNCSVSATVTCTANGAGFCYDNDNATISNCYMTGDFSNEEGGGAFVYDNTAGAVIEKCYFNGTFTQASDCFNYYASFCYVNENSATIRNCYSQCDIIITAGMTQYYIGGFVSFNDTTAEVENCYTAFTVEPNGVSPANQYGFCGQNNSTITACFWDTETSDIAASDGGTGKTTVQMKKNTTFIGWPFCTIWFMINTVTYPLFDLNDGFSVSVDVNKITKDNKAPVRYRFTAKVLG